MANFEYQFAGQLNVPGAMLYNGREASYPIYESCSTLHGLTYKNSISLGDIDDTWSVLPGYKIIVYQHSNYSGTNFVIDNTNGSVAKYHKSSTPNDASSLQLFYKNIELNYTLPDFDIIGGYRLVQDGNDSNYTFLHIITNASFKYNGSNNITNVPILIVGGGGGGAGDGGVQGGGGGGAGEVGMGILKNINQGRFYNITIGSGGTSSETTGYPTSISEQNTAGSSEYTKIVEVYGGGRGQDNDNSTQITGGSGGGGSGKAGSGYENRIKGDTTASPSRSTSGFNNITFFRNGGGKGGTESGNRGGGGGGGAGGGGGNAGGWEGGNGGSGKTWTYNPSNNEFGNNHMYGGGGAGQGVNGYTNHNYTTSGGGGKGNDDGTPNTGGGGSALQDTNRSSARGGSGIVIFRIPNSILYNKT